MIRPIAAIVALVTVFRLVGYLTEPSLADEDIHRVVGDPARLTSTPQRRAEMKIATWNIERGVKFDRILDVLRNLEADVVLLQEVDRFCKRSGNRDVARELADGLNMNWISGGEFQEIGEAVDGRAAVTGQAILSRYQILDPGVVRFPEQVFFRWRFNPLQPRRGGRMALRATTGGIVVYSVHLESGGDDRLRGQQLANVLSDQSQQNTAEAVIAGDFNNSGSIGPFESAGLKPAGFVDALGDSDAGRRTTPKHPHPIDWVFVKGALISTGRVAVVDDASDHYPVVATIVRAASH